VKDRHNFPLHSVENSDKFSEMSENGIAHIVDGLESSTPDQEKGERERKAQLASDLAILATGEARTAKRIEKGRGKVYAVDLQNSVAGKGNRSAARALGLSVRAIRRLRRREMFDKVEIKGKPRPE